MPNQPNDPYGRFPLGAAVGLFFMLSGGVALLVLSATWHDWRQAALGALFLAALSAVALLLRRVTLPRFPRFAHRGPGPGAAPPVASDPLPDRPFDPASFLDAVRSRSGDVPARRVEGQADRQPADADRRQRRLKEEGTIKRLQDLRDHPATPETERQAADAKLKKARTKRRSAWRGRP